MKLVRYGEVNAEKPGLIDSGGTLRDLSDYISDIDGSVLGIATLDRLSELTPENLPVVKGAPRLGACVGSVGKLICIGLNFHEHAKETGNPVPKHPIVFMKATSAINGPFDDVVLPRGSQHSDWEIELGVVIGERAPLGPWLVTADEIADPQNLAMTMDVNGERMQTGNTNDMIFSVREIIAHLSGLMTLYPGDVIATGTPAGVGSGKKPEAIFLRAGDRMAGSVEGLGKQEQVVVSDPF